MRVRFSRDQGQMRKANLPAGHCLNAQSHARVPLSDSDPIRGSATRHVTVHAYPVDRRIAPIPVKLVRRRERRSHLRELQVEQVSAPRDLLEIGCELGTRLTDWCRAELLD